MPGAARLSLEGRRVRLGDLATGLVGAGWVLPIELISLHTLAPGILWAATTFFAVLGIGIGWTLAAVEALVVRLRLTPVPASLLRGASTLLVTVPLLRHLFDGGYASTLRIAPVGHVVVPLAAALLATGALWLGTRLRWARVWTVVLALFAIGCVVADKRFYPRGYGNLHLLLAVAACVAAGLATRLACNGYAPAPCAPLARRSALTLAVVATFGLLLRYGFASNTDRWIVANHWTSTHEILRLLRSHIDLDHDGFSAALGGPDCNDKDPDINPLVAEIPGNAIDENCDGVVAPLAPAPVRVAVDESWRARPEFQTALAHTRDDDVLLLSIDAVRAELMADTPENRRDFPHVFGLLDESHVFRRAFSTSASTYVALPTLVTGMINPFRRVHCTLPEMMRATGRVTHGVIPRAVLRWVGEATITRGLGGFDRIIDDSGKEDFGDISTSAETTSLGLKFVDEVGQKTPRPRSYLWLHYFDVHEHAHMNGADPYLRAAAGGRVLDAMGKYRAMLRVVDLEIGRLVDGLRSRGRWDHTTVVLVADHGEGLAEEPRLPEAHNEYVYNKLVHVPLAIRVAGVKGAVDDEPVSLADVVPTLSDLIGQAIPQGTEGTSLAPLMFGGHGLPPRPLLMTDSRQYAVIEWPWKLLVRPTENLTELYDLSSDFDEHHDLSSSEATHVHELGQLYQTSPPFRLGQTSEARRRREEEARAQVTDCVNETR